MLVLCCFKVAMAVEEKHYDIITGSSLKPWSHGAAVGKCPKNIGYHQEWY